MQTMTDSDHSDGSSMQVTKKSGVQIYVRTRSLFTLGFYIGY